MLFRLCSYRRPRFVAKNRFESVEIVQNRAVKKPWKLLTVALRIRGLRGKPCTVPIRIRGPLDPTKPIRRYLNPLWWTRLEPWSQTSTNKEPNWKKWSVRSLAFFEDEQTHEIVRERCPNISPQKYFGSSGKHHFGFQRRRRMHICVWILRSQKATTFCISTKEFDIIYSFSHGVHIS